MWPPPVRWPPARGPPVRSRTPEVRLHVVVRPVLVSRSVGAAWAGPRPSWRVVPRAASGSGGVQPRGGVAPVLHQGATPSWWTGRSQWNEPTGAPRGPQCP
ncbi:unnamed protein product [Arctogadus glacialis]